VQEDHILSTAGDAVREHLYFTHEPITIMINQSITIKFILVHILKPPLSQHKFTENPFSHHYNVDLIQNLDGGALSLPFKPQKPGA
jgi:hypothetical protein